MTAMTMAILLIVGHCLADYAWQGDFMAQAKSRAKPFPGVPFWQPLAAHSAIHGGFVALITGIWWLGLAEAVIHGLTDDAKCTGKIGYNTDQAIHFGCKALWLAIATGTL